MRCLCCNAILTPYESSFKSSMSGEYVDMCTKCFNFVRDDIDVIVNRELEHEDGTDVANYIDDEDSTYVYNDEYTKNFDDDERVSYE